MIDDKWTPQQEQQRQRDMVAKAGDPCPACGVCDETFKNVDCIHEHCPRKLK